MKVVLRPVGEFVGEGQVFKVRSTSDYMLWHYVAIVPEVCESHTDISCTDCDGSGFIERAVCSCKGFNGPHKKCWHISAVFEWRAGDST